MTEPLPSLTTASVAKRAGVHRDTLLRWLRDGLLPEPTRDRRGWRIFSEEEAAHIERFSKGDAKQNQSQQMPMLEAIDWDFADAKTTYLTHRLHPYPAKFIPQIPNALIQELSCVGDTVADIFCGSGTTLVESLTLKRHAVGVDANPLACLISEAKTAQLDSEAVSGLQELLSRTTELADELSHGGRPLFPDQHFVSKAPRPIAKELTFWFEPHIVEELAEILSWCRLRTGDALAVALCAFSAIVVAVSKQDSDTRYVRREKQLAPGDTARKFARTLSDSIRFGQEFTDIVEPRFRRRVINANVLDAPDIGEVDMVVCSPPYPNAYSYHRYHMTRMLWLEMDQPQFKKVEIGSHRKFSAKGASINIFRGEMDVIFQWLAEILKPASYACFVIGQSIIRGELHNNADIICETAAKYGFSERSRIARRLKSTKKSFNPAIGKIKTEEVVILQR